MGSSWRRFSEKAKQDWHISMDNQFEATKNSRNSAMLADASEFARNLRTCEKEIQSLKTVTEGMLLTTRAVMSASLPRVFEEVDNSGEVRPVEVPNHLNKIGGEFDAEELTAIATTTARKIEAEVLGPLSRWEKAYEAVQTRMKRLEGLRLEVDSRRRTVQGLRQAINVKQSKPQQTPKGEFQTEQLIRKMQHKENKLASTKQSYMEQEEVVNQQLSQLIRDAVWLKSYLASVMRLSQEAFSMSQAALGPQQTAPPPEQAITNFPSTPEHTASGLIGAGRPLTPSSQGDHLPAKQPFPVQRLGSGLPGKDANAASAPIYAARENYPNVPNHALQRRADAGGRADRYGGMPAPY